MLRIIVDSGSSIRQDEKGKYNLDILPLRIEINNKEYLDSIDLTPDNFYELLDSKNMPKTSLPNLGYTEELIQKYLDLNDDVLVITISSSISGTYQSIKMLFDDNPHVLVYDSKLVLGGIRFLVEEAIKYRDQPLRIIEEKLNELRPRVVELGIPSTLDYLLAGGRLSKAEWMVGTLLSIRPVVGLKDGKASVIAKKRGLKQCMRALSEELEKNCDYELGIIPSYSNNIENLNKLIEFFPNEAKMHIKMYDNIAPSIACHIGSDGCGVIFISK